MAIRRGVRRAALALLVLCGCGAAAETAERGADPADAGDGSSSVDGGGLDGAVVDDAYARFDAATSTWTLGTSRIEKRLRLADGHFTMIGLTNKLSGRDLLQAGHSGVEFQVTVDGAVLNGSSSTWVLERQSASRGAQNVLQLDITLHDDLLEVSLHYRIWPGTGVIEQAIEYRNRSGSAHAVADPEILDTDVMASDMAAGGVTFDYFTGGRDAPGALRPMQDATSAAWSRSLNSQTYGSNEYLPEVLYRASAHDDGILFGWSYTGTWYARFGGDGRAQVDANGANGRTLSPGAVMQMPWTHTLVFRGDLDDAGNDLKDFQYRYKWDMTHEQWVGNVKPYLYDGQYDIAKVFALTQYYRAVGADMWHWDSEWYDHRGDWNNRTTTKISDLNAFAAKSGMGLMVWMPIWEVDRPSKVVADHPTWAFDFLGGTSLDLSNPDAVQWMQDMLDTKTAEFGTPWVWRQDGCVGAWGGPGVDQVAASANFFRLMATFRERHPESGININQCGGLQLSLETVRHGDVSQTNDGRAGHFSVYTPSYFYPPDKLWGTVHDDGTNFNWGASLPDLRASLVTSWQWDGNGSPTPEQLETFRFNIDLYHFMAKVGVAGRWVKVYHPDRVDGDDRTFYVQRMSADAQRGVIIGMHAHADPAGVRVYPKGLVPDRTYVVSFQNSRFQATDTGANWMSKGIATPDWGGDLVWLNVDKSPGSKRDTTAPGGPASVHKAAATYLGRAGMAIDWKTATDDNWISYYEILKNGVVLDRSAHAPFYFDPSGASGDQYAVRAVDGDGNRSPSVTAAP
jgi:hypothetical protein